MKISDFKKAPIEQLVSHYIEAAAQHRTVSAVGDHHDADKISTVLNTLYREMVRRGKQAQQTLLALTSHDDPAVRLWAARHSMDFAPQKAALVLKQLTKSGGIISMDAATALREWQHGQTEANHE